MALLFKQYNFQILVIG